MRLIPALLATILLLPFGAQANTDVAGDCTLIVEVQTLIPRHESGDCTTRRSPQSTFKLPLAVMGYDSGILIDAQTPSWTYEKEFSLNGNSPTQSVDPIIWEKESIVWFSQKLTTQMGFETFRTYIEQFKYGNMDVRGMPGQDNGLTDAWLSSSLKISPKEQIMFLNRFVKGTLGVKKEAYEHTKQIIPSFTVGQWTVHGKTGTEFQRDADGNKTPDLQLGWFVGWAESDKKTVVFAKYIADAQPEKGYAGLRAREAFLAEFPALMEKKR